jgi:hypothetical protein
MDTVTAECYCGTVESLPEAFHCRRLNLLHYGIIIWHDNARPLYWQLDLWPVNGAMAGRLQTSMSMVQVSHLLISISVDQWKVPGWFAADASMKQDVISWLQTLYTNFFNAGIQALPWLDRCLTVHCGYIEVWYVPSATYMPHVHWSKSNVQQQSETH